MSDIDRDLANLNAATREAHEAIKELRQLMKELEEMKGAIFNAAKGHLDIAKDHFGSLIEMAVERQMEGMTRAIDDAIEVGVQRSERQFEKLTNIMLRENEHIIKVTGMSVTEYIAASLLIEQQLDEAVADGEVGRKLR